MKSCGFSSSFRLHTLQDAHQQASTTCHGDFTRDTFTLCKDVQSHMAKQLRWPNRVHWKSDRSRYTMLHVSSCSKTALAKFSASDVSAAYTGHDGIWRTAQLMLQLLWPSGDLKHRKNGKMMGEHEFLGKTISINISIYWKQTPQI